MIKRTNRTPNEGAFDWMSKGRAAEADDRHTRRKGAQLHKSDGGMILKDAYVDDLQSATPRSALHSEPPGDPRPLTVGQVREIGARIRQNIERVIEGKQGAVAVGLAVLLAEGHLLIEDVPGVGKTKFAKALARSIDC